MLGTEFAAHPCSVNGTVLLCGLAQRSDLRSGPSGFHGAPQVPLRLQREPDLRVPACQRFEQERVSALTARRPLTIAFSR